eukprot:425861_1
MSDFDVLSQIITILYGTLYGLCVIVISIIALNDLQKVLKLQAINEHNNKNIQDMIQIHMKNKNKRESIELQEQKWEHSESAYNIHSDNIHNKKKRKRKDNKNTQQHSRYATAHTSSTGNKTNNPSRKKKKKKKKINKIKSQNKKNAAHRKNFEPEQKYTSEENTLNNINNNDILEYIRVNNIDLNTIKGKLKFLWYSVRNKRSMYISILVHIFDTATDIGVIFDFYQMSKTDKGNTNINGIDIKGLFYLSIATLLFYRIVSSIIIYSMTNH